ncbi:MAG: hypothetical protein FWH26_00545 [Oscillospiraceae bacterium]|nr:hypothetical protein [Oscillospiraceae bacterium]
MRKLSRVLAAFLMVLFLFSIAAFAETTTAAETRPEEDSLSGGSFQLTVPLEACLDALADRRRVDLVVAADKRYMLALNKVSDGAETLIRFVVASNDDNDYFYAAVVVDTTGALRQQDTLQLDVVRSQQGNSTTFALTTKPDDIQRAAVSARLQMAGETALTGFSQDSGAKLQQVRAVGGTPATPAGPGGPSQSAEDGKPSRAGIYVIVILLILFILAGLLLWHLFRDKIRMTLAPVALQAGPLLEKGRQARERLWPGRARSPQKTVPEPERKPEPESARAIAEAPLAESAPRQVTRQLPKAAPAPREAAPPTGTPAMVSTLAGVELIPPEECGALLDQVSMDGLLPIGGSAEESAEPEEAVMNAYFLGKRSSAPLEFSFATVGLRNRDILRGAAPESSSPRPCFAANDRGQVFSLAEGSGNLYLHIEYFAPPSFVVQSVLGSECLEHIFALEDVQGNPLRLEDVRNRKIIGIQPARTEQTGMGFAVTKKGTLIIGSI